MTKTGTKTEKYTWKSVEESLAAESGLAIVLVEGEDSKVVSASNDNSICQALQASADFAPECAKFCGSVYRESREAGGAINRRCHAGLNYSALPVPSSNFVAIIGRSFDKSDDYRKATERAISGDWAGFDSGRIFENVLLSGSKKEIEKLAKRIANLSEDEHQALLFVKEAEQAAPFEAENDAMAAKEPDDTSEIRSFFGSLLDKSYREACKSTLLFLQKRHGFSSLAWLEKKMDDLRPSLACGNFKHEALSFRVEAGDERLKRAFEKETSIEFKNKANGAKTIQLFPLIINGELKSAVIVDNGLTQGEKKQIARFVKNLASPLEILRLREQLERQAWLSRAIRKFNENLRNIDTDDYWAFVAQTSAELMKAERSSILLYDDNNNLIVKGITGNRNEDISLQPVGEGFAQSVARSGRPLVIKNLKRSGMSPSPGERRYKSDSFISYPIRIGNKSLGVLNITDKIDGGSYDEFDLELLNTIAPQIAVAIDRASLKLKAGEFEQLSITDPLTGLVNRRYLEIRLSEEVKRSMRHGYPMSFMMIDVDEFKSYNDKFLHTEGDKALQMVAQCLKDTLRGADIAARYGGEEFSILLPQTTLHEAHTIAERIREKVAATIFPNRQVTVSIGVAACSSSKCNSKDIIAWADKALYQAKGEGRNIVKVWQFPAKSNGEYHKETRI